MALMRCGTAWGIDIVNLESAPMRVSAAIVVPDELVKRSAREASTWNIYDSMVIFEADMKMHIHEMSTASEVAKMDMKKEIRCQNSNLPEAEGIRIWSRDIIIIKIAWTTWPRREVDCERKFGVRVIQTSRVCLTEAHCAMQRGFD